MTRQSPKLKRGASEKSGVVAKPRACGAPAKRWRSKHQPLAAPSGRQTHACCPELGMHPVCAGV
ncbi:MAG: hypothetical protein U0350_04150 [Caldilineaceae bacterium]